MICVYAADCKEFSTNGLGVVTPQSCSVTETLNGEYELTLVHPIDVNGKWLRLLEGRILRAPVPSAMTPQMNLVELSAGTLIYRVSTTGGTLNLRSGTGTDHKILSHYRNKTEVIVLNKTTEDWYEVTCPDGKHGYMSAQYLTYVRTEDSTANATNQVVEQSQLRDQPFRIYRVVPDLGKITVYARHIFYDMMDNMVQKYEPSATTTGAAVTLTLPTKCLSEHEFTFYSDLDTTAENFTIHNINPVEAILGDEGIANKYKGELVRDWYDVYLVKRVGADTNVQIREKKNLLGIAYDVDISSVATRIMPTGQDADGEILYLPELYIDSPNVENYPAPKWAHLDVSEAKEVTSGDDKKTKEECYEEMRKAVQAEFDAGCDLPAVSVKVDFINCANTVEYAQYAALQNIFLGDAVSVIAPRIGIAVSMRMTQYTYDCLQKKYTAMTLGTSDEPLQGSLVSASQLGSGSITGTKLAINSVGAGQLQSGSVGSLQIQAAAIQTAHIQLAAITSALIADAAITTAKIAEATIGDLNASSLATVTARIEELAAKSLTTDKLYAALAAISAAEIKAADIDYAKVKDLTAGTAIIAEGTGGKLYIARLAVTEANMVQLTVGSLMLKAADGSFVRLVAGEDGTVTTELVSVAGSNIASNTIAGTNLIENTITARELNVQKIFADAALISAIKAANIDVADLFAAKATISQLDGWIVSAATIKALEDALDLWADDKISLAVGNVDTSTAQNVQNSSVAITKDMVKIETPTFTVRNEETGMTLDEEGLSAGRVYAPNLSEKYTGSATVKIGAASDASYGSLASFASAVSGKYLPAELTVSLLSDMSEPASFRHVSGAGIRIEGGGYSMFAPLKVENCASRIAISAVCFSYSGSVYSEYIGSRVYLSSCIFNIASTARSGQAIYLDQGALLYASNCQFYNTLGRLITVAELSRCVLEWCAGAITTGPAAFNLLLGADLRSLGSYPSGTVLCDASSTYTLNGTADSGTSQGDASALTTQSFACSSSDTCRGSSNWDGSGYVWQGYTSSGIHRGYMWFDGLASAISGKTITSATLKVTRVNGIGRSGSTTLSAYYTSKTSASGTQSVDTSCGGEIGSIANDETKVFDLPAEILQQIADAGSGGFTLYSGESSVSSGKGYSTNYCKLYGYNSEYPPELTVTWN